MSQKLLDSLNILGYKGSLVEKNILEAALQEGAKSIEYTQLVNFLTNELRTLLNIDEEVNVISGPEDAVAFIMEITSFLKELNCTYSVLTQGHISDRLQTVEDRLLLLDYLSTELMAARILQEKKPNKQIELKLQETDEAANLRKVLMTLRFPKPPANITIPQLFQKVCPTVQQTIQKVGKELIGNPAFNGTLSDKQWETLKGVQKDLNDEYKIRREMLLTRLDVTIQSFQWSDRTKGKEELFEKIYTEKRKRLKTEPDVELADLLAARDVIAIIEKTSSSSVRKNTRSSLNKVIIGQVPDRGGRTSEQAPPPPEMPSWQQRVAPSGGGRGGGRGGRGGGNFNRSEKQNYSRDSGSYGGSYSSNQGGGYSSNQGGGYSSNQGGGYSSNQGGGYSSNQGGGYPSNRGGGYSSNQGGHYTGNQGGSYSSNQGGGYSSNQGGSYSGNQGGSYSTNQGGYSNDRSNYSQSRNFDSAGSYGSTSNYGKESGYSSGSSNYSGGRGSYDNKTSYDNRNFDSAGSYGKDFSYEQNSKRPKTFDSFQSNRTTQADEYVKEEQHNQQYHGKGGRGQSRGRSNYNRGGRNNY